MPISRRTCCNKLQEPGSTGDAPPAIWYKPGGLLHDICELGWGSEKILWQDLSSGDSQEGLKVQDQEGWVTAKEGEKILTSLFMEGANREFMPLLRDLEDNFALEAALYPVIMSVDSVY